MLVTESFHGFIETTQDVLLIFEGCRRGLLPRICRRLQERERKMIRSGSVFVFDQRESGIKRWTDGRVWSPSRILGNFLIYRELDKRNPGDKKMSISSASSMGSMDERRYSYSIENATSPTPSPSTTSTTTAGSVDRNRDRQLVGSLSDTYKFRQDGLIKKTMSIVVNGVSQHLISYYDPRDVLQQKLRTPSSVPELASLEISPELLVKQNFRIPPMVEPTFDHSDGLGSNNPAGSGALTPPDSLSGSLVDRRMHPLRSMSLGSVRPELPLATSHAMYSNSYQQQQQQQQAMDLVKQEQSPTMTTFVHHPPPPLPVPNSVYNTFSAVPSPTSMSSSPSTPILSPARASFQHQRHYSTSSASSSSLSSSIPRYDPRHYSTDYSTSPSATNTSFQPLNHHHYQQQQHQQQSHQNMGQIQLMPDGYTQHHDRGSMNHSQHYQPHTDHHHQENHAANLGQLLNPVHPLQQNDTAQHEQQHHHHHHHHHNPMAQPLPLSQPTTYTDYASAGYDGKETTTTGFAMSDGNSGSGGSGLVPMSRYPMTNQHSAPTLDSLYALDISADDANGNGFHTYY